MLGNGCAYCQAIVNDGIHSEDYSYYSVMAVTVGDYGITCIELMVQLV